MDWVKSVGSGDGDGGGGSGAGGGCDSSPAFTVLDSLAVSSASECCPLIALVPTAAANGMVLPQKV